MQATRPRSIAAQAGLKFPMTNLPFPPPARNRNTFEQDLWVSEACGPLSNTVLAVIQAFSTATPVFRDHGGRPLGLDAG